MRLIQRIQISRAVKVITPIGLLLLTHGIATAHNYSPNRSVKTPYGIDVFLHDWVDSSYEDVLDTVVNDYNTHTDVTLQYISGWGDWDPNRTLITYQAGDYSSSFGAASGYAETMTLRYGDYQYCEEGHCDDADYKILIAHVYINTSAPTYAKWKAAGSFDQRIFTHETGHAIGIAHAGCMSNRTVMSKAWCYRIRSYSYKLGSHDTSEINAKY